jgi:1,4-dihydroxy-2-naphthoate octaprenyltransferase
MSRETAKELFGLCIRLSGLFLAFTYLVAGTALAVSSFTAFLWWLMLLAVVWFLLFRADVVVQRSYPKIDSQAGREHDA